MSSAVIVESTLVSPKTLQERCKTYLEGRRATYADRRRRFQVVGDLLVHHLDLQPGDVVVDLGAGHCQLDFYLRAEMGWQGVYVPVDGVLGTDLDSFSPREMGFVPDVVVCMETLEHLKDPERLLGLIYAKRGVLVTTPNAKVVDVLGCDKDHRSVVTEEMLHSRGFTTEEHQMFGTPKDTVVAWRRG
jgi:hypothetical protein